MAENDSKRYYWLKLKKDFFQQHQMKVLKSLPNGRLYALIYLELLAESTSHEGRLRYSDTLPYDVVTLASVIDEDKDNLENAIKVLRQLELLDVLSDETIYLQEVNKLIGSETFGAERKREYRENSQISKGDIVPQVSPICPQENRVKSKEIRVKSKEINKKINGCSATFEPPTLDEVKQYCIEHAYTEVSPEKFIDYYTKNGWTVMKSGKRVPMQNWWVTLGQWQTRYLKQDEVDAKKKARLAYAKEIEMKTKGTQIEQLKQSVINAAEKEKITNELFGDGRQKSERDSSIDGEIKGISTISDSPN